ncbi:MAG: hypothetical protein WB797_10840 [Nocardioides sp.]
MGRARRVLAAVVGLVCAWPAAAAAQTEYLKDRTGDAVLIHFTRCSPSGFHCHRSRTVDHRNRTADVVWARNVFGRRNLTLTMKVRGLTSDKRLVTYLGWEIDAPHRQGWSTQLVFSRGHAGFDVLPVRSGHTCPGAHAHVGRAHDLYRLTLPASCLGSSHWVRVSESTMVVNRRGSRWWYDDPRQGSGLQVRSGVAQEELGPRLHRRRLGRASRPAPPRTRS